jgi:hypothetical protein
MNEDFRLGLKASLSLPTGDGLRRCEEGGALSVLDFAGASGLPVERLSAVETGETPEPTVSVGIRGEDRVR